MVNLELRGVSRSYGGKGAPEQKALRCVDLKIEQGEFVAIVGPSGGGKSTLLNVLGLLDSPTGGSFLIGGVQAPSSESSEAADLRSSMFGFVFQAFHLLDRRPVRDSAELGALYAGWSRRDRRLRASEALRLVGLEARVDARASTLSGGQRQRVAIARAFVTRAPIILADEPTGNLDSESARSVIDGLKDLHRHGATVVVVTHSDEVAAAAERRVRVVDGAVVEDTYRGSVAGIPVLEAMVSEPADPTGQKRRRVRALDVARDAWASIGSRRTQTFGLCLAVAAAISLCIGTVGLSTSASAQVSAAFDAQLNREVTASWDAALEHSPPGDEVEALIEQISGVEAVATVIDLPPTSVETFAAALTVQPHQVFGDIVQAAGLSIEWPRWRKSAPLQSNEVLIGESLARQLQLGPLDGRPAVSVSGRVYQVVGLISESRRLPLLEGEILFGAAEPRANDAGVVTALIRTEMGAAQVVGSQAPLAINPYEPELISISAPTDPTELRQHVEDGMSITLIAMTALAALIAVATLSNATMTSVNQRRGEIGVRKAVGARSRQVGGLIALETVYIGFLGGAAGLAIGIGAILAITISQRWAPVLDIRLIPLSLAGGVLVGLLGGLLAASRAMRMHPAESLRL